MCSVVGFSVLEKNIIVARFELNLDEGSVVPDTRPLVMCWRELEAWVQNFSVDSQLQKLLVTFVDAIPEGNGRIVVKCAAYFEPDRVALSKVCTEALAGPVAVVVGPDVDTVKGRVADVVDAGLAPIDWVKYDR